MNSKQAVDGKATNSPPGDSDDPGNTSNVNPDEGIGVFRGLLLTFLVYILVGLLAWFVWVCLYHHP
jgi:hypothetical protein